MSKQREFRFIDGLDKSYTIGKRSFVAKQGRPRKTFTSRKHIRTLIAASRIDGQGEGCTETTRYDDDDDDDGDENDDDDDSAAQEERNSQVLVAGSMLDQSRRDPFQTTAGKLNRFEMEMIDAWMTTINRNFDAPTARFTPQKNVLYSWVREDQLTLYAAVLYGMKSLIAANVYIDHHLLPHYRALVYSSINRRLDLEGRNPSLWLMGCILGVLCAIMEVQGPDEDTEALKSEIQLHLDGVNVLIDNAGGWRAVSEITSGFTWMLMWANTATAGELSFGRVIPAHKTFTRPMSTYGRFPAELCRQMYADEFLAACAEYFRVTRHLWEKMSTPHTTWSKNPLLLFRSGGSLFHHIEKDLNMLGNTSCITVLFLVLIILFECRDLPDHVLNLVHEVLWSRLDAIGSVDAGSSSTVIMALWTDISSSTIWNIAAVEMLARHLWVESRATPATRLSLRQVLLSCLRPPALLEQMPEELWSSLNLSQKIYRDLGLTD